MARRQRNKEKRVHMAEPHIIGYMSVDGSREYHHDLSELKYVTSVPQGDVHMNLNHNIDKAIKRTTDDNAEKTFLLLKFLLDQKDDLKFLESSAETNFITYRRTLIQVMCCAVIPQVKQIVASFFNNSIYLHVLESPHEVLRKESISDLEKRMCAWGYKFEQFLSSDTPHNKPDTEKPVIENAEFSLIYATQLGNHKLVYGAQIDGMLATDGVASEPSEDAKANLHYLRSNRYVELKTNKEICHWKHEASLKRYKMVKCWCQCYLANLQGLIVGYRNDEGIVRKLEWFTTQEIVDYCKDFWHPQKMLDYLDYFLSYVKNSFESLKKSENLESAEPFTLLFEIDAARNMSFTRQVDTSHLLLPDWYVNALKK